MEGNEVNLGFTRKRYPEGTHMCLIYKDDDDRKKLISKYLSSGIESGEKVSYFAYKINQNDFLNELKFSGVDFESINSEILDTYDVYTPNGYFSPEDMLEKLKNYYNESKNNGYCSCRVTGEMHWALDNIDGAEKIVEYEAKVNEVLKTYPVTAVCQYNAQRFEPKLLLDCLKVHPYIITNGQILENPYYLSAEDYINSIVF